MAQEDGDVDEHDDVANGNRHDVSVALSVQLVGDGTLGKRGGHYESQHKRRKGPHTWVYVCVCVCVCVCTCMCVWVCVCVCVWGGHIHSYVT